MRNKKNDKGNPKNSSNPHLELLRAILFTKLENVSTFTWQDVIFKRKKIVIRHAEYKRKFSNKITTEILRKYMYLFEKIEAYEICAFIKRKINAVI